MSQSKSSKDAGRLADTQASAGTNPQPQRSWPRICLRLVLIAALVFTCTLWLEPIKPYATLSAGEDCRSLIFSPDCTMCVTAGKEGFGRSAGPLRIWDLESGGERMTLVHEWKAIETICFSPDSSLLAAHEQEGDLKLWDTRTGTEVASFRPVTKFTNWVNFHFSPDGRYIVFDDYGKGWPDKDHVAFWHIASKREQGSIERDRKPVYSPDRQSFVTIRGQPGQDEPRVYDVALWRMSDGPKLVKRHRITTSHLAVSSDLLMFATADERPGGTGHVALWDMETGQRTWSGTFRLHDTHLQSLSFMGNDKVLSTHGGGGTSRYDWHWRTTLWDVTATPKLIGSYTEEPVVSPDGEWLAIPIESGVILE